MNSNHQVDSASLDQENERDRISQRAGDYTPTAAGLTSLETDEWLRLILTASQDGIVVEDNGYVVYTNEAFARMLGYDTPEELIGFHASEILHPEDAERMGKFGEARLRGESPPSVYEFKGKRKDNSVITAQAWVSTSTVGGRAHV